MSGSWKIASVALIALGLAMTSGCVPAEKFKEAQAAARNARAELEKSQAALQAVQEEKNALQIDLEKRRQEGEAKDKIIASLQNETDLLSKTLKDLKANYDRLVNRGPGPVLPEPTHRALEALAKDNPELMEYLPNYGMIKLKADLTFPKGSAEVGEQAKAALRKLAEIVNTAEAKTFHIYVAGHTDDIPLVKPETIEKHGTNWGLSAHRALAVVQALFEAGVAQQRMAAVGFGKFHPVAPNAPGNRGNPLNRRVEIWIVPPDRLLTIDGGVLSEMPEKGAPEKGAPSE